MAEETENNFVRKAQRVFHFWQKLKHFYNEMKNVAKKASQKMALHFCLNPKKFRTKKKERVVRKASRSFEKKFQTEK